MRLCRWYSGQNLNGQHTGTRSKKQNSATNEKHKSIVGALRAAAPTWAFEQINFVVGNCRSVVGSDFYIKPKQLCVQECKKDKLLAEWCDTGMWSARSCDSVFSPAGARTCKAKNRGIEGQCWAQSACGRICKEEHTPVGQTNVIWAGPTFINELIEQMRSWAVICKYWFGIAHYITRTDYPSIKTEMLAAHFVASVLPTAHFVSKKQINACGASSFRKRLVCGVSYFSVYLVYQLMLLSLPDHW